MDLEDDSPLARFFTQEFVSILPPNTPTKPRAMGSSQRASRQLPGHSRALKHTSGSTKRMEDRSESSNPAAKRMGYSSSPQYASLSPRGDDHWSAHSSRRPTPTRELFPSDRAGIRERDLSTRYSAPIERRSISSSPSPDKYRGRIMIQVEENQVEEVKKKKKYPNLTSVAIPELQVGEKLICYNCGGMGHWLMDCMVACGRCAGNGYKTIDCDYLGQGKLIKMEKCEDFYERKRIRKRVDVDMIGM